MKEPPRLFCYSMKLPRIKYFEVDERFSLDGKKLSVIELNGAILDGQYLAEEEIQSENSSYTVFSKYSGTEVKGFLGFGTRHHFHIVIYDHQKDTFFISKESCRALTVVSMIEGVIYFYEAFHLENKKNARQLPFTEVCFAPYEAYEISADLEYEAYMNFEDLGILDTNPEQLRSLGAEYKGAVIENVFYLLPNYPERDCQYDQFHLVDMAVLIEFNNGKRLNWVWLEETQRFHLSTKNILALLEMNFDGSMVDVSNSPDWKKLIYGKVTRVDFLLNGTTLSDLIIEIQTGMAQICATEEPDPDMLPELVGLPMANEWSVVVFDQNLLKKHNRLH